MPERKRTTTDWGVVSLFCGAGGLDWGFHRRGFQFEYALDRLDSACATYERNFGIRPLQSDLRDAPKQVSQGLNIVLAGPPCQGFSSIGRRDPNDPRNDLILQTARLIARSQTRIFIIENVVGLRWSASGQFIKQILKILGDGGLEVGVVDVNCSTLGVAQYRRRLLIVGGRGTLGRRIIKETERAMLLRKRKVTVGDVLLPPGQLRGAANHSPTRRMPAWYAEVIASIGPGQKLCDTRLGAASIHSWNLPSVFGHVSRVETDVLEAIARLRRHTKGRRYADVGDGRPVTDKQVTKASGIPQNRLSAILRSLEIKGYISRPSENYVDLTRKFNGRFKRLAADRPAPAVLKEFGSARNVLHPLLPRGLTVRECARLQGIPDDFEFVGTTSEQYQLVANAFPPPVSYELARAVERALGTRMNGRR